MTMNSREWDLLLSIKEQQNSMAIKIAKIELQIASIQRRDKIVLRVGVPLLLGIVTWFFTGQFPAN